MDFKFPDVGEGITEGEIVKWHIKVGDTVKEDQTIAEVETDKAVVQIPSPTSGKIIKVLAKEGETVKVGQVIVQIGGKDAKTAPPSKEPEKPKVPTSKKKGSVGVVGDLEEAPDEPTPAKEAPKEETKTETTDILALPAVRKVAKELGVDLGSIHGSGKDGSITKEDVEMAAGKIKKSVVSHPGIKVTKKYDMYGYIEHVPLHGLRKTIAKNMMNAQQHTAFVTHMDEVDVTHLVEVREKEKERLEKQGIKLTYLPFIIKAIIKGCEKHPLLNATLDEEAQEIIIKKYYNIGIAVDTEQGLIVPVIKRAKEKSVPDLAKEIIHLAELARTRKINIMDLQGGTITITSLGSIGGVFATPIINYPEVANIGIGKIKDKPVVVNGKIVVRKMLTMFVTFDHRVVDGAEAARFLNVVMEHLNDPDLFLVE